MKFTQKIRERNLATGAEHGPAITFTVEADAEFPVSPDALSAALGHLVMKLMAPGRSISTKSTIDPWPLPDDWTLDERGGET